jgi:hypothetical protein
MCVYCEVLPRAFLQKLAKIPYPMPIQSRIMCFQAHVPSTEEMIIRFLFQIILAKRVTTCNNSIALTSHYLWRLARGGALALG